MAVLNKSQVSVMDADLAV